MAQTVRQIQEKGGPKARSLSIDPETIRIMAVTKTVEPELVNAAIGQGIRLLGENRVQEYLSKADQYRLEGLSGPLHRHPPPDQQGQVYCGQGDDDRVGQQSQVGSGD